jgi:hypothetical protein
MEAGRRDGVTARDGVTVTGVTVMGVAEAGAGAVNDLAGVSAFFSALRRAR